ncbi:hypothetical protein L202_02793 [Cryptococcus amylolentus CBS 6039]|uniref:Uncharacterized protein n=2 Tax=Cryptococcus amylolentus TaxID=104669 RepID=A0A1E3HWA1_9TREE|nr:hypothetical protein L202_02793 [Cryptococcus amylolentus CBS 6039]ODN80603.1 hypothetical protein L202_02793 [Cryptococcus amylolentus CBS 6039]ODO09169.1 hypothetical protein I350_02769 [Cryptococcus amylolentus CBS 6273]
MENEPGFVTSQDMVVPLNDVDPHPLKDPDHAVRATISDQTADTTTSTAEVAELHALASRPDKHHVEPINVSTRLSGASNSDRDITVPLNDLSVATYTMPKASQTVSKITQRQSTPYRSRRTPRTSKTSERSEDLSLESARNQTEDDEADNQVGRKEEHPLGMAPVDDTWLVAVSFPSPPVTPNHSIAVHPLADTGATRLPGMTVTRPLTPRLKQREVFSTRGSSELGLSGALVNRPREIPNVNKEDERSSGRPSPDFWETEGNWRDPFGFWLLCLHVTSNFTGPYHTSVPARHLVQRCPTPSSFSSMSYRNSEASNLSTEVSSQQPSSPVKTGWKGAQVLARMEGKVDQSFSQRQRAKELFKKRRGDKRASRVCRKRRTSSIDLSDGEGSERAKRIIHYEDLRMNHQLAVEEVWD